jgi:hypothetical protein
MLWIDKLKNRLLPTPYFHIVFTVPEILNGLFYINQRACYDMLFKASAYAIKKTAANPAFLGAETGNLSVLHTWGQSLNYHPHIHALVPAGGMDPDGQQWIQAPKRFGFRMRLLPFIRKPLPYLLSFECHSPIMAAANNTPFFYLRQPEDTIKGQMYYDLEFTPWVFEIDQTKATQIEERLMSMWNDYPGALKALSSSMKKVDKIYKSACQVVARTLKESRESF